MPKHMTSSAPGGFESKVLPNVVTHEAMATVDEVGDGLSDQVLARAREFAV